MRVFLSRLASRPISFPFGAFLLSFSKKVTSTRTYRIVPVVGQVVKGLIRAKELCQLGNDITSHHVGLRRSSRLTQLSRSFVGTG